MDKIRLRSLMLLLASLSVLPLPAQSVTEEENSVSFEQIRQLRAETERDRTLGEDLRTQILDLYGGAITLLEKAAANRDTASAIERDRSGIDRTVARLRAELEEPEPTPRLPLSSKPSVAEAEDALTRERARLAANRSALRNHERIAEDRAKSRNEISQRLGELDLELELLDDEMRRQTESTARTELKVAVRKSLLARRDQTVSETEMLRARLALLGDRSSLVPLETDLAQRRVTFNQEMVELLEQATHEVRVEEARLALRKIQELSQSLAADLPFAAGLAAETEEFARTLWAPDGVADRAENSVKALEITRHHQAQLNRIAELTSRKFEAYGRRGSVTRWWPDVPEDFPEPGSIAGNLQALDEEIPEVEHRLITYEQQRSNANNLSRQTMFQLQNEMGDNPDPEMIQRVRELLAVRQDLLDELIQRMGRYSNHLVEYQTASRKLLNQVRDIEKFLYSHILWSRSVPKPIIPRPRDMAAAAAKMTPFQYLNSASLVGIKIRGKGLFAALLLVLLVVLRQPLRNRLKLIADRVNDPEQDHLMLTVKALMNTVLLAAPLPIAFYFAGVLTQIAGKSTYWFASTEALFEIALVAALFELIRQIFSPNGLAEAHFVWPTYATRPLYRGLLLTEAIGLPLLYLALHLAFAGMRLDSPDQFQLYNNSLGRVAFMMAMLVFGLSILAMLRPEKKTEPSEQDMRVPWPRRFSEYAFPTAFLGAYPIIIPGVSDSRF